MYLFQVNGVKLIAIYHVYTRVSLVTNLIIVSICWFESHQISAAIASKSSLEMPMQGTSNQPEARTQTGKLC